MKYTVLQLVIVKIRVSGVGLCTWKQAASSKQVAPRFQKGGTLAGVVGPGRMLCGPPLLVLVAHLRCKLSLACNWPPWPESTKLWAKTLVQTSRGQKKGDKQVKITRNRTPTAIALPAEGIREAMHGLPIWCIPPFTRIWALPAELRPSQIPSRFGLHGVQDRKHGRIVCQTAQTAVRRVTPLFWGVSPQVSVLVPVAFHSRLCECGPT